MYMDLLLHVQSAVLLPSTAPFVFKFGHLRLESKHFEIKKLFGKNFKNLPKTMAERHHKDTCACNTSLHWKQILQTTFRAVIPLAKVSVCVD